MTDNLQYNKEQLREFCRRWHVHEFAVFGSVLTDHFGPNSDIDVLLSFDADVRYSLLDLSAMADELQTIFGRRVDVLTRKGVEESRNPYRRQEILASAEVIDAN